MPNLAEREELLLSGNFGRAILTSLLDLDPRSMPTQLGIDLESYGSVFLLQKQRRFFPWRNIGIGRRFFPWHHSKPQPELLTNEDQIRSVIKSIETVISHNYAEISQQLVGSEILINRIQQELGHYAFAGQPNWHNFREALLAAKESLRPLAQLLAKNSDFDWWWSDIDAVGQRWISQREEAGFSDQELGSMFEAYKNKMFSPELSDWDIPIWWVTPRLNRISDTTRGPIGSALAVKLVCNDDWYVSAEKLQVWNVEIPPEAKIYEVHTPLDWIHLVERFPKLQITPDTQNWLRWTGCSGPWLTPDWKAVAEHFDGVHVSIGGHLATAYTAWPIGDHFTILTGWHPDATFWIGRSPKVVGERL
jgi:hypothetical protein